MIPRRHPLRQIAVVLALAAVPGVLAWALW